MAFTVPKGLQADKQLSDSQFSFKGAWQPDYDPAKIGPENFKLLQNLRYVDGGLEGVLGYTKINTTALTTYTKIWNGFHLRSNHTQTTYVLVHAVNPATGQGRVYENRTAIPSQGDFEASQLHADASVNLLGRFSDAPGGGVAYCNGEENYIYNGDEMRVSGFFRATDAAGANAEDFTEEMNNTLTDADELCALAVGSKPFWFIFSTRPLTEANYVIDTINDAASTMTGFYWDGAQYSAVSNLSDGTDVTGTSMAQSGKVTWDAQSDAEPHHFKGLYLYAYYFTIDAGTALVISNVTVKAPWQKMVDVWDGVYRQPIQFQLNNNSTGGTEDYTLQVNESSSLEFPIGGELDAMQPADKLYIMFEERMSAIRLIMLGDLINKVASVMTVKYWNGSSYTTVGATLNDDTQAPSGDTLGKTGLISWNPPASTAEKKQTAYGTTGYMYEITVSVQLTGTEGDATPEVIVDVCTGIPAQKKIRPFKFSSLYKGRLMRGNYVAGKEGNRLDFTSRDAAEVWNGWDSSMDGLQSLYFGGMDDLTASAQLYNRFGSRVYTIALVLKPNETYILDGDSPEDYKIFPVSQNVGCPAPLTIDTAEVGFSMAEDIERNVAIWLSYNGPVMFDGAVLKPIDGIDIYFDPNATNPIDTDNIDKARGWIDKTYSEYNLLLPVGTSQTTNNKWFLYDLKRKKWFEKDVAAGNPIQCGFQVNSTTGVGYTYGGNLVGGMMRLENGATWDGTEITQKVHTGDFWPSDNIWHQTRIRYIMIVIERIDEDVDIEIFHFKDTDLTGTDAIAFIDMSGEVSWVDTDDVTWASSTSITLNVASVGSSQRLARDAGPIDKLAWSHGFAFELATSTVSRGFKPVAWAIRWEYERHERTR
jgi:hypothetical protein